MNPSARARSRDAISSKSCADTLPIARSNSSSLIARSASIFSRSRSARRRSLSGCPSASTSAVANGASIRYSANPAAPAAPMVRLISRRFSAEFCLARTTATLAATSDSSTKKCHGLNAPGASFLISVFGVTASSIEVAELIVQPCLERGASGGRCRRGPISVARSVAARPAKRHGSDNQRGGRSEHVRERPRQAVEAPDRSAMSARPRRRTP